MRTLWFAISIPMLYSLSWSQVQFDPNAVVTSRPYYFSGPCTSQGSWTQEALNQTQRLREITTQLRDDPSCKALGESLQRSFGEIQSSFEMTERSMGGAQDQQRNMGHELTALQQASIGNPALAPVTAVASMDKMIKLAGIKTLANDKNGSPGFMSLADRNAVTQTGGDRVLRVANRGFQLFNQTIDSLPRLNECLTQKNVMGQVLASSVSMLGALVSSGQDHLGNQAAMAISKIANYMRDKSFAEVLSKLNQQEFMTSIQCIMETTSESYCSARDSQLIFKQMTAELQARKQTDKDPQQSPIKSGLHFDSPLNGYYVLTRFSPIVTDWIFRMQIGSSPKLREDGMYQTTVMNNANSFYIRMKEIESEFNQLKRNISTYKDFTSKQNYAKDLVLRIGELLSKSVAGNVENFFQNAGSEYEVYFNLLGMSVPKEVQDKGSVMAPSVWLAINYRKLPVFNNPDNVPNIVWEKLKVVFDAGKANMLSYYFKSFVADHIGAIDESLLGIPYNIKNALVSIDVYLEKLQTKIQQRTKDHTMLGSIADTRHRIGKIFYRYNQLRNFVEKNKDFLTKRPTPDEERAFKTDLLRMNLDLMEEVYDKFEVMLAKSGFLANRLVTYVTYDFQTFVKETLRNRNSEHEVLYKEIAYASGQLVYDQMVQMAANNPTSVQFDLSTASRVFKENLATQEMLFTDALVGILQQLKLSSTRPHVDSAAVTFDSIKRSYRDGWQNNPSHARNPVRRFFSGVWSSLKTVTGFEEQKYPVHYLPMIGIRDNIAYSTDDENRSAEGVFNRMCIQALSFNDYKNARWRALYHLCKDAYIRSPLNPDQSAQVASFLKIDPNDYLSVSFEKKFREDLPDYRSNHSKRICAFRDYNRRNLVVYLTLNFNTAELTENNYSDNPYDSVEKITPDPSLGNRDPNAPKKANEHMLDSDPSQQEESADDQQEQQNPGGPSAKPKDKGNDSGDDRSVATPEFITNGLGRADKNSSLPKSSPTPPPKPSTAESPPKPKYREDANSDW